jgi:hypothetical protein
MRKWFCKRFSLAARLRTAKPSHLEQKANWSTTRRQCLGRTGVRTVNARGELTAVRAGGPFLCRTDVEDDRFLSAAHLLYRAARKIR